MSKSELEQSFLGKVELNIGTQKISLPYEIVEILKVRDRIILRFDDRSTDGPQQRAAHAEARDRFISIINNAVWCFNLDGKLIWKIADAFSEDAHERSRNRTGHRICAEYVGFRYEPENDCIVGITSYGNRTRVKLSDGSLISRTSGSKM